VKVKTVFATATALMGCYLIWRVVQNRHGVSYRPPQAVGGRVEAREGDRLCKPNGEAWPSGPEGALILLTSSKCPACTANRSFDDEVDAESSKRGITVYYSLSDRPENIERAADLARAGKQVVTVKQKDLPIYRTPTAIRINSHGTILAMWTGTVAASNHDAVLTSLISGITIQGYKTIPVSDASGRQYSEFQILGFSAMTGIPETKRSRKIIPAGQVATRATFEIPSDTPGILVDCTSTLAQSACQEVAMSLAKLQRRNVVAVGLPEIQTGCRR
jgi:hypothetical protein